MVQPFPSATQAKSQTEVIATNAKIPFQMRKHFIATLLDLLRNKLEEMDVSLEMSSPIKGPTLQT